MDSKITFFSLNVGMSASLAGLDAIIKAENLDIVFGGAGLPILTCACPSARLSVSVSL